MHETTILKGRCKSWTLDSGLDPGLDSWTGLMDWTLDSNLDYCAWPQYHIQLASHERCCYSVSDLFLGFTWGLWDAIAYVYKQFCSAIVITNSASDEDSDFEGSCCIWATSRQWSNCNLWWLSLQATQFWLIWCLVVLALLSTIHLQYLQQPQLLPTPIPFLFTS